MSSAPSPARLTLGALIPLLMQPSAGHAQAWLPEAGSFNFNSAYSDNLNKKHYLPDGEEFDAGQTRTQTIALNATYALTDDWLLEEAFPSSQPGIPEHARIPLRSMTARITAA